MSGAAHRTDIKREFDDAVNAAGAYLRALEEVLDPITISATEYREREIRIMRNAILKGWTLDLVLPIDPFARHATSLGFRYLHCGRDAEILDVLFEWDCSHKAYREALQIIVCRIRDTGANMPERLRRWEKERGGVKGRWTPQAARDHLIGSVIDVMASDRNFFFEHRDPIRGQLERDLKLVYQKAGNPPDGLYADYLVANLKKINFNRWGKWNDGQGLTELELSEFLKQPWIGVTHAIKPEEEVRTSFQNLRVTRGRGAKHEVSLCDAVRHALDEISRHLDYQTVVTIWKRYNTFPVL